MAITVRRLAEHPGLGLALVAGIDGADRVIEWAHPIELADPTPWLSGGELVMTTGLKIGGSAESQFDYVSALIQAGTVALAFDTGTTFDRVPDGICAAGDALGLPILAVPPSTPFIAISRAVIDELTADRIREVQEVVSKQEKLARETLSGGIPAVISALARAVFSTVAVIDTDGRVLAEHGTDSARVVDLARSATESARAAVGRRRQTSKVVADGDGYCMLQSISAAEDLRGFLAVRSVGSLSSSDRLLVSHAVSLISIELGKPAKVVDAEHRLRAAVTRALLSLSADLDVGLLRYFGFDSDSSVVAVVFADIGPLLTAERQAANVLGSVGVPYLMASMETGIVVIFPADRSEIAVRLHHQLGAQLQRAIGAGRGVSAPILRAAQSVKQAGTAARVSRLQSKQFVNFAELETFSLLFGSHSSDELRALEQSMLGVLDAYDSAHPGSTSTLVATLEAFLEHNGQTEVAAAALGVHRHTMRNRLKKIVELTDRDLDSAHIRAELWIALKARELLRMLD
ncbi:PucR family transcriptional regulator [Rhodococcus sp. NPDC057529]|uniref:PucR family transcriptional regulator n=1 Tax=Rhodococcus sp. NPDC057529 TaxID=3346158 RepID=UPI00366B5ECA